VYPPPPPGLLKLPEHSAQRYRHAFRDHGVPSRSLARNDDWTGAPRQCGLDWLSWIRALCPNHIVYLARFEETVAFGALSGRPLMAAQMLCSPRRLFAKATNEAAFYAASFSSD
jgi:hypothetical protein